MMKPVNDTLHEKLVSIRQPIPEGLFQERRQRGGKRAKYLPWPTVVRLFDERAGIGAWANTFYDPQLTTAIHKPGEEDEWQMPVVTVRCDIEIFGSDRSIKRSAISSVHVDDSEYGLPPDSAQWMSFRQAAQMLGLPISAGISGGSAGNVNDLLKAARGKGLAPADVMAIAKGKFKTVSLASLTAAQCGELLATLGH